MKNLIILKKLNDLIQDSLLFILIFVVFLPDYVRYPLYLILVIYTTVELIIQRDMSLKFMVLFLGAMFGLSLFKGNLFGSGMALLYASMIPLVASVKRRLNENTYQKIQYYIVWGSLFNFPLIYTNYAPRWYLNLESSIMSSFDLSGFPSWKLPQYGVGYFRAYSTFDNPNFYAFILLIVVMVCFNQLQYNFKEKNIWMMGFYTASLVINMYAMILTGTRSVLVATAVGAVVLILVQQEWQMLKFIIMMGCLGLSYIILNPELIPRLLDISAHMGIRTEIWENALALISRRPYIGDGFMSYAFHFDTTHAHNIYIESMLSLGVVGSVVILVYMMYTGYYILKNASFKYFPFALAIVVGLMTFGVLDFPFYYLQTPYLFVISLLVPYQQKI